MRESRFRLPAGLLVGFGLLGASCAGSSDPDSFIPSGGPVTPPSLPGIALAGVAGVAVGESELRVDVRPPEAGFELALFWASTEAGVYAGAPAVAPIMGTATLVTGLPAISDIYIGLGIRSTSPGPAAGTGYTPVGSVWRARTGPRIYLDPAADPAIADGTTPQTAFASPVSAFLTAFAQGGGNVWAQGGTFDVTSVPLLGGVHVYGGFDASWDLANRDPQTNPSIFLGSPFLTIVEAQGGGALRVMDGIEIDGGGLSTIGIDVNDSEIQLRGVRVENCTSRGIRIRNGDPTETLDVRIASTVSSGNSADGLSVAGAFDFVLDGCRFDANGQEGVDFDDLVAPDGETASLEVRACGFFGNAAEGMDVDLAAPTFPGPTPGAFRVEVEGCVFELNGSEGLLLDQDHEFAPGWAAEILVRGCDMRANILNGMRVDADAESSILLHRNRATGNGKDGVWLSSESAPGFATVSACELSANLGAGLRASLGNKSLVVSHCVIAGNVLGGMVSETVSSASSSSVTYLQPAPSSGFSAAGNVDVASPGLAPFVLAPEAYGVITSQSAGDLGLTAAPAFGAGSLVEVAGDGVTRTATAVVGSTVSVDPAPTVLILPGALGAFPAGAPGVDEDWSPAPGSVLLGAGLSTGAGASVDAGPFGAPVPAPPGILDEVPTPLFRVADTEPAPNAPLSPGVPIALRFTGGTLDPASPTPTSVRFLPALGPPQTLTTTVVGNELHVNPPPGGWGVQPFLLAVDADLASLGGAGLCTPVAIPF